MNENVISLNVPNIVTIGIILALWALIFVLIAQVTRRASGSNSSGS